MATRKIRLGLQAAVLDDPDVIACVAEIIALDVDRANKLEEIANRYGFVDAVQEEINQLRHPTRTEDRLSQIRRTRAKS